MNIISENLFWVEFYSKEGLREFQKQKKPISAIYIWGWFNDNGNFVPFYVGKHFNLHQRLFQHVGCLNGGLYTLYEKSYVLSGKFKPSRIDKNVKPIYSPFGIGNFIDDFMSEKVQDSVKWFVDNIQFTWMETNPADNAYLEKYVAHKLEKNDIYLIFCWRIQKN